MSGAFKHKTEHYQQRIDAELALWFRDTFELAPRLSDAMAYAALNGGKRIRPILVYATAEVLSASSLDTSKVVDTCAAAVECIHAYSLVHDDLPAMDDDDLRRGMPTTHIKFDEATAILAGDALQTLAFEKLSALGPSTPALELISELTSASGARGMVGGQMLDLLAEGQPEGIALEALERIHVHKTGALIRASVRMGAIAAGASATQLAALTAYSEAIGLAFQVHDDVIDVCSDTKTLGKLQGADVERGKSTYVSLMGLCGAQEKAESLIISAKSALASASVETSFLNRLADYIIERKS